MTQAESGTETPRGPVFVGGTGRSGTTIVGELIGSGAAYALVPMETRFQVEPSGLADLARGRAGFDELNDPMRIRSFYREPGASGPRGPHVIITREALDEALERLRAGLDHDRWQAAGQFLRDVLDPVATRAGKETWVEMTPPNAQRMNDLARMLPEAKFINMVRDGRDVASSVVPRKWGPNDFPDALKWWANQLIANEAAAQDTEPQRVLTLRLESFIGPSRQDAYGRLADFLSVADDPAMREFFDAQISDEQAHQHRWTAGLDESQVAQYQNLYETHLQRLADAGAGLPKPGLESVPGEIELPGSDHHGGAPEPTAPTKKQRRNRSARRHTLFDGALRTFKPGRLIDLGAGPGEHRSEEHTPELQSRGRLVCRRLL